VTGFHLAQINVGRLRAPVDDPMIADFVANLDRINALAEGQPGFVWRLVGEGNDATDIQPVPDDPLLAINMSVWADLDALAAFVYRTAHREVMRRRREWFEAMETYMALWWVPVGHTPTPAEGVARLAALERLGPTAEAFTFKAPYPAPDGQPAAPVLDECA
jgi:heme-degrading monooxygenase HmoA